MMNFSQHRGFSRRGAMPCFLIALAAAASLAIGCGGDASSRLSLDTPQATLDTVKQAMHAEDFQTFAECLTEDALNEMAGGLRMVGEMFKMMAGMAAAMGGEADQAMTKFSNDLESLIKKHVPTDAASMPNMMSMAASSQADMQAAAREAGSAIRDKKVFVADAMKLLMEISKSQSDEPQSNDITIGEIEIDGDTATATVSGPSMGGDGGSSQVTLRRVDGQWKIANLGGLGIGQEPPGMQMQNGPGMPE